MTEEPVINLDSDNAAANVKNREEILGEWDKKARAEGKPFCRTCAQRDIINKGSHESRESYSSLTLVKTEDVFYKGKDASMGGKQVGFIADFKCAKNHGTSISYSMAEKSLFEKTTKK